MTTTPGANRLPTGTIAFLMTDIEGSTVLVGRLGDAWPRLLDEHFTLMRAAVDAHDGTWVSSEGDAVFAVFPSVQLAAGAAVQAERESAHHEWPQGVRLGRGTPTAISNMEPPLDQARRFLDATAFDRAVAEGEALDLDEAEREGLALGQSGSRS